MKNPRSDLILALFIIGALIILTLVMTRGSGSSDSWTEGVEGKGRDSA